MTSDLFKRLGLTGHPRLVPIGAERTVTSESPATRSPLGAISLDDASSCEQTIQQAADTFRRWRAVPAPVRGQVVRAIGEQFRRHKADLGELVSLEVGKIRAEGQGEIQEVIDIADFAVGLSRQLPGLVAPSERPGHRLFEQWLSLGPVGVITAFNFPAAVWGWNAALAAVCGDVVIWKPSLLAPLTALACNKIAEDVSAAMGHPGVFRLVIGTDDVVGERLVADRRVPLISATGSCRMGKRVGGIVAQRLGRALLELGGNNACIVHEDADLDLAVPSLVFGAVGTAGQRCTTTRRLIVHESIADRLVDRLVSAYKQVLNRIGDPLKEGTLVGPLISEAAVGGFERAIAEARKQGGTVLAGGGRARVPGLGGHFVQPTIIRAPWKPGEPAVEIDPGVGGRLLGRQEIGTPASNHLPIAMEETFAPILYIFTYRTLDQALTIHNRVDQGLSSAMFTDSIRAAERFLAPDGSGSDCGLAYVNLGTSGAEIGGAFGGEKDTGGGRESGSDSWKSYMRRQTCTVNFSGKMELAQGIRFE